ncbi:Aldo/keto reductase [Dacryopinax primogenitus]|uniref:Aldo/keto reductase n=1 Tax=Dacryopinax primogenitus (strain DJM 731) TaxID=1858805 RepID=M5FPZ5_DACPD|nr:Aldo/keto reductase [Dacryopinax primogenitus]EJT98875.1 Aldo/keto reductase [Dacryopinax primogenitus]
MSQPQVEYRRLGNSGLRVSVPILGAMSFGSKLQMPWVIEEEEALQLLKAAWDRGINTWDTANVYSAGESERIIAKAIKKFNIPRHKLIIMTKCKGLVPEDLRVRGNEHTRHLAYSKEYINQWGLSRTAIFNQVEASLKRLDTTYIDLYQIHRADPEVPFEETMLALHDIVKAGKVRYIGASSMWTWQLAEYQHAAERNGWTQFVSMQNHFSLLYREEQREMVPYCNYKGIGLIPWGPVAAGQLARSLEQQKTTARAEGANRNLTSADEEIIRRVEEVSKKRGWTMAQVALAWIDDKVSSPIVGFSSVHRMEEAIIPDKKLTAEEKKYLEEPYQPTVIKGHD